MIDHFTHRRIPAPKTAAPDVPEEASMEENRLEPDTGEG
jgi:hypothetical protein